jgi:copper transport protein
MLDLAAAIIKGLGYLGALGGAGLVLAGATLRAKTGLAGWVRAAGVLLVTCACATAWLFIARLGGMDDPAARDAVVGSRLGAALGLQMAGGLWLAAVPSGRAALVGALAILASFGVVGHAATLGPVTSLTVILHLMAAAWWLGGLLLLFAAGARSANGEGALLLSRFSRQAIWIVAALVLAASATAALLLDWRFDPAQTYHRGIAAKAGFTAVLIALAGLNRFVIVPRLTRVEGAGRWLQRIIAAELAVILGVLATTAWLTSFHSPHEASHEATAPIVAAQGPITILDAWSSPTLTSVSAGAGYMTIANNQDAGDALIAASSPWAEAVTLHRSSMDGGIARMQSVAALPLPARSHLSLAPGGYHLMLTGLYSPLVAGDTVPITLTFQKAGAVDLMLTVRPRSGAEEQHHHH